MKKLFKSKLLIQVVVASMVATLATAGIVAAATTVGSNINTTGTLTATGATTIYGATSVGGALTATSTLGVTGVTTLTGNLILSTASSTGLVKVDSLQLGTVAITPIGTELNFVDGVTSAIQTQLDAKSPLASPTFTGTVILPTTTLGGVASSTSAGVTSVKLNGLTVYGDATVTGTLIANTLNFAGGAITGVTDLTSSGVLTFGTASSTTATAGSVKLNNLTVYGNASITGALTGLTTALTVAQGGTGSTTLSGILKGNGTGVMATAVADTDYLVPATAATTYSPLASPTFTGTVILPITTLGGVASSTVTSANSVKLNNLAVYGKVGIASSTPLGNLAIGTAGATSTISMGYFCIAAQTEAGTLYYVRLDPTQVNVFATSTTPCNQ